MKTSLAGRQKIMQREGCVLHAYKDSVGVWTIGVGHSAQAGTPPHVHKGMVITQAQALDILAGDLAPRETFLSKLLRHTPTQAQFDAMMSLMFNIGNGAFEHSRVLSHFNGEDIHGAAAAVMDFVHPAVLVGRRRSEMQQFLGH